MPLSLEKALEIGKELSKKETTFLVEVENQFTVIQSSYLQVGDVTSYTILPTQEVIKERQYKTPLGLCHSVTEILSQTKSKEDSDRLRKWQKKMDKVNGQKSAEEARDEAKARGTLTHSFIENYLKGEIAPDTIPENNFCQKVTPILKLIENDWVEIEKFTYSNKGYAGRFDLLANFENKLTIFDWKTSKRAKRKQWLEDAFIQTTAYALAENERSNLKIDQVCVVVISPEQCQIFTESPEDYKELWNARLQQFKQLKNV